MPIILLGAEFWKKSLNFDYLLECGMCSTQCFNLSALIHAFPPVTDLQEQSHCSFTMGIFSSKPSLLGRKKVSCSVILWQKLMSLNFLRLTQSHLDMLVFKDSAEAHQHTWLGQRMTLEISCCFFSPSSYKSMEPPWVHKDAFQYLVETVRKAEESGETEQARSLHIFPLRKPWVEFVWKVQSAKRRRLENKPSVPSTPSKKDRWIVLALVNNKNPYKLWVFSRFGDLIKVDFRLGRSWRSETRMVWSSSWAPGLKNDVSPESCGNSATSSRSVDVATLLQKPWRWCLHPKKKHHLGFLKSNLVGRSPMSPSPKSSFSGGLIHLPVLCFILSTLGKQSPKTADRSLLVVFFFKGDSQPKICILAYEFVICCHLFLGRIVAIETKLQKNDSQVNKYQQTST